MAQYIPLPKSVNFHLIKTCNYSCKYCHSRFNDSQNKITQEDVHQIVRLIADVPSPEQRKITFVGGEPTLLPWLSDVISTAKVNGLVTMVVTNGSRLLDQAYLETLCNHLDWVGLSIDSTSEKTNREIGRATRQKKVLCQSDWIDIAERLRFEGVNLKVNTVVSRPNLHEDLSSLIALLSPDRWKIMQVMEVIGQNDDMFSELAVSLEEFNLFVDRNKEKLGDLSKIIAREEAEDMRGSYAMIDPQGRFFDSVAGHQRYSDPILKVGVEKAWKQVSFSNEKFRARGGDYEIAGNQFLGSNLLNISEATNE